MIAGSSLCQTGFPRIILPGVSVVFKDTVVAITVKQMDAVNEAFIFNDQLKEIGEIMAGKLAKAMSAIELLKGADSMSQHQILIANGRIAERDELIKAKDDLEKHQKKKIRNLRIGNKVLGVSTGAGAIAVIILLLL